jgi:hypothetical protein
MKVAGGPMLDPQRRDRCGSPVGGAPFRGWCRPFALAAAALAGLPFVVAGTTAERGAQRDALVPDPRTIEEACAVMREAATALGVTAVVRDAHGGARSEGGMVFVPVSVLATGEPTALVRWLDRIGSRADGNAREGASRARVTAIQSLRLAATAATTLRAEGELRLYLETPGGALPESGALADRLAPLMLLAEKHERFALGIVEAELGESVRLRGFTVRPGPAERVRNTFEWAGYEVLDLASEQAGSCERFELVARSRRTTNAAGGHESAAKLFVSPDELCLSAGSLAPERFVRVDGAAGDITMRLRGMDAVDVFHVLNATMGRGYVVEELVAARVSLEAVSASADAIEEALARELGLTITAGPVRRVGRSAARVAWSPPEGGEYAMSINLPHEDVAILLQICRDMTGWDIVDPPSGARGSLSVFVTETPIRVTLAATLEAAGLRARAPLTEGGLVRLVLESVEEPPARTAPGHPCALGSSRRVDALVRTEGESRARCRCLPVAGVRSIELAGLVRAEGAWTAWIYDGARATACAPGYALADGKVAVVDREGITLDVDGGHRLQIPLPALAELR